MIVDESRSSTASEMDRVRQTFDLMRAMDSNATLRPLATTVHDGRPAIVYEDFAGASLSVGTPMAADEFLRVAERITAALAEIHHAGVIHKNIRPDNILVDPATGAVKLTGFGLAARLLRDLSDEMPRLVEGSLPYMSPEQTGRMNRAVDNRSDLYSLGIVFFELLTGRLPFDALDTLAWVHSHVARPAPSPRSVVQTVPEPIAEIVLKLLSKRAESRYQSASGLAADLAHCRAALDELGRIAPFPLGARDVPDRLQLPQKLYGREAEVATLERALARVVDSGRAEMLLVSGYSGTGKSTLVHELVPSVAESGGMFLSGKFEQLNRGTANFAIAEAFRAPVAERLGGDAAELAAWRRRMADVLGPGARLVTDLVPELGLALSSSPRPLGAPFVPAASGLLEDGQQFYATFTRFVAAFAEGGRPLVLFLDDLQWSDAGALTLLEYILAEVDAPVLVIAAYRDNKLPETHPLHSSIARLRTAGRLVDHVHVAPLGHEHLTAFVADTIRRPDREVRGLSSLLFAKTRGNPFFVQQFLHELVHRKMLWFDHGAHRWRWDSQRIRREGYTDNVAELLAERLRQLPARTLSLVETASMVGSAVSERTLAIIAERDTVTLRQELFAALREGLLIRAGGKYRFAHDRVQRAAYSLIPELERPARHASVGRLLLASTPETKLRERVFGIVRQLNAGRSMLGSEEQARLSELNLEAGRKAKAAAAYTAATSYLATGVSLLRLDEAGGSRAELAFELRLEHARCQILAGELDSARELLHTLGAGARTKRQLANVACAEVVIEIILGDDERAALIGLRCLDRLDIHWSARPTWEDVLAEQGELDRELADREIESLLELPAMSDPDASAIMDVLTAMKPAVVAWNPNLMCIMACRMVRTSIEYGNTANSGFGYLALATAFAEYLDRWEDADRLATVGRQVAERFASPADRGKAELAFALVHAWRRPFRDSRPDFEHTLESTLRWGDVPHASYTYSNFAVLLLLAGAPLPEVRRVVEAGLRYTQKSKYRFFEHILRGEERFLANLEGRTAPLGSLDGDGFEEAGYETELRARGTATALATGWFCTWRMVVRYLTGRYEEALHAALAVHELPCEAPILLPTAIHRVFHALTRAALAGGAATPDERAVHLDALRQEHETLRLWAKRCPECFEHFATLVGAEIARVEGDHLEAQQGYEHAIAIAREQALLGGGALALEVAGRYYLDRGFVRFGETYLADARNAYERWGAAGKVRQLEERYPTIARAAEPIRVSTIVTSPEELDLLAVTKASQSIAEETKIEDVVCTLMRVALEQGVAERGYLVLADDETPMIRAAARCSEEGCAAELLAAPVAGSQLAPEPLVTYVLRSGQQVILADASDPRRRQRLVPAEYVARHAPRSVLCHPIVRRGALVGALYLESSLVVGGFTPQRVAALELIAAQAAISLEIAHVIEEERRARLALEKSESRFRRLYESNMIGIAFSDLSGSIFDANDYVLDLLGYTRKELEAGIRWDSGTLPEGAALAARAVADLRDSGTTRPFEMEYVRTNGTRVSALIGPALVDSATESVVTFVLDVTERRHLLLQEQQARADAERALRVRDDFIAVAAHELRTPLTPLKLQLQMLQQQLTRMGAGEGAPHRDLVKLFATADRQVDQLTRLVGDLLDFSRLGTGRLSLERDEMDLAELAREVVERHRPDWVRSGSLVLIDAPDPVRGRWDRQRLDQVIVNLLSNAMKYGGGKPIDLAVRREGDLAKLIVRDRGIGIRDEDQSRIFDRFERAVSFKHFSGFGLGLYIGIEIARAHGGTIRVASQLGEGSTFTLELATRDDA